MAFYYIFANGDFPPKKNKKKNYEINEKMISRGKIQKTFNIKFFQRTEINTKISISVNLKI
jgi:hypothetical protein